MLKLHFSSLKRGFHNLRAVNEEFVCGDLCCSVVLFGSCPPKIAPLF